MVHKKSEYRLQFRKLAEDLRKSIWVENVKLRELRRSVNQATHYWSYQLTDERCECEDDENELSSCRPANGDASQRSTEKQLASSAKDNIATDIDIVKSDVGQQAIALPSASNSTRKVVVPHKQQVEVHAVHQKDKNRRQAYTESSAIQNELGNGIKILARKDGISGSEVLPAKNSFEFSSKQNGFSEYNAIPEKDAIPSAREAAVQTPDWEIPCCRRFMSQDDKEKDAKNAGISQRSVTTGAVAPPNSPSQLSQSVVSRTTRRHHSEGRKTPFAMFGWNSTGNSMAVKKTHNVCAPESEVYTPALLALKKRREQVEKFLAEERKKRQQRTVSATKHQGEVNHSSLWMSEYKDKFSRHDFKRELLPFPCSKPPTAWRYS